ncbi:MAG: FtsX-like permease family protein, partial [Candidatus Dormibacteraceae bacterium]
AQVQQLDSELAVANVRTLSQVVDESVAPRRFNTFLLTVFASFALILAFVGLYGVISCFVSERTHEIGIRMALGAERNDVLKLILGQGFRLALTGVAIGIIGALALMRVLSSLLYGVRPTDPLTFAAVSLLLTSSAFLASHIPARRAVKVDPMVALRHE